MLNKGIRLLILAIGCSSLIACKPASPDDSGASRNGEALQHGFTLSQSEFNGLSKEDQFMVANKALSTMYRGLPADEFFDLTQGLDDPQVQYGDFIKRTQIALQTKMSVDQLKEYEARIFGKEAIDENDSIPARFDVTSDNYQHLHAMARMQGYPLGSEQFVQWMSYFLANTIMFSPADEMESTNYQDTARVLKYLQVSLSDNTPIRDVVRGWLNNLSRWRVSRSPENHALEMFELYLGVFNDTEEEQQNTLNGGKACSAWKLSDASDDYQLESDPNVLEGTELVTVFNKGISKCSQLYDLVAGDPRLVPRAIEVIVNYFLDGSSIDAKQRLIQNIVTSGAQTFQDVFLGVIFSKEFLLQSSRPKTFEENAFGFLNSMHWTPRARQYPLNDDVLYYMLVAGANRPISIDKMGWASMEYKIGRTPFLPMDALSFATYHKAIREQVLLNQRAFDGCNHPSNEYRSCRSIKTDEELAADPLLNFPVHDGAYYVAGTENLKPELENLTAAEFIDFIFLSSLGRRATDTEMAALIEEGGDDIEDDNGVEIDDNREYLVRDDDGVYQLRQTDGEQLLWENRTDDFGDLILDYISRLPEFYYYRTAS